MNNEKYNQIIDEAYEKYHQENKHVMYLTFLLKEEFIRKCKTNPEFSKTWGLKIEERELSLLERYELMKKLDNWVSVHYKEPKTMEYMDSQNIPAKLITITYNNEIIESYE
jgi:hypothetical protein